MTENPEVDAAVIDLPLIPWEGTLLSLGDVVHYRAHGSPNGEHEADCRMAFVVSAPKKPKEDLSLFVVTPNGTFFNRSRYDEDFSGGTYHHEWDHPYEDAA